MCVNTNLSLPGKNDITDNIHPVIVIDGGCVSESLIPGKFLSLIRLSSACNLCRPRWKTYIPEISYDDPKVYNNNTSGTLVTRCQSLWKYPRILCLIYNDHESCNSYIPWFTFRYDILF